MTAAEVVAALPAHVALGLGADGLTVERVRDRLALIGGLDPERAHGLADELAVCALRLIRDGHPRAVELARDTLVVLDAAVGAR